jgi:hypothetical protein
MGEMKNLSSDGYCEKVTAIQKISAKKLGFST